MSSGTTQSTTQTATTIPDKLFFKIGEVCELVGVQAHVLRYWESEFPMLQPQKNRAGQRTYRRKDVEMALRIRELLYDEGFTIAGARKKLSNEGRGTAAAARLKVVTPNGTTAESTALQSNALTDNPAKDLVLSASGRPLSRDALLRLRLMLEDLLTSLKQDG
ncbi:MAG TPA: MerR family transcriptional regulator [Blastocatellia bacterium]|nr:MerR family transcriptional regulator [Blastocatellia bacterium]